MINKLIMLENLDRIIHEPSRTMIVAILSQLESADFLYLRCETGLTQGNLSAHLNRLEKAGYIQIEKTFRGKIPRTLCSLTKSGRKAFETYRQTMKSIYEGEAYTVPSDCSPNPTPPSPSPPPNPAGSLPDTNLLRST